MLQIFLDGFTRRETHGEVYAVVPDELRDQLLRVGIKGYTKYLETLSAVIFLDAAQNLSGVLAVWSSGVHECEQHYFSGVLAQQNLLAIVHTDDKLARGPRHFLGERCGGDKRETERGKPITKSHKPSVTQQIETVPVIS